MRVKKLKPFKNGEGNVSLMVEESRNIPGIESVNDPLWIHDLCIRFLKMDTLVDEHVYEICLNTTGKLIGVFEVSHGSLTNSFCNAREVMRNALLCNAASVVIVHNHPSEDVSPSDADRNVFCKLKNAIEVVGVQVLDSMIIGGAWHYYSFAQNGG